MGDPGSDRPASDCSIVFCPGRALGSLEVPALFFSLKAIHDAIRVHLFRNTIGIEIVYRARD